MSREIEDLDIAFQDQVAQLKLRLEAAGIPFAIAETRRDYATQADAFRRGASKRDGLRMISMHQAGLAVDIVPLDDKGKPTWEYARFPDRFKAIGRIARTLNMACGQDWEPIDKGTGLGWDPPHYEFKG